MLRKIKPIGSLFLGALPKCYPVSGSAQKLTQTHIGVPTQHSHPYFDLT